MEALWNLEDHLKLSTPKAVALLFLCTSFLAVGLCIVAIQKMKARRNRVLVNQEPCTDDANWFNPQSNLGSVKKILMNSVEWCSARKLEACRDKRSGRDNPSPLLVKDGRKGVLVDQEQCMDLPLDTNWSDPGTGWGSVKKALMSSVEWCSANKLEPTRNMGSGRQSPLPLLVKDGRCEADVGWGSHNSDSPVWQRPILMGDKCELPRFSGLILYDEKGCPVHYSNRDTKGHKDKTAAFERTTLRDLLC